MENEEADIIIIGAGISGICMGIKLKMNNHLLS